MKKTYIFVITLIGLLNYNSTHPTSFSDWTEFNKKMREAFLQQFKTPSYTSGHSATDVIHPESPDEPSQTPLLLTDIKGTVPQEIYDLRDYLQRPEHYAQLGIKPPCGILLIGKPGTGKTTIARALAAELKVPFIYASGSEFIEMYVGVGAARIRELFAKARKEMEKTGAKHAIIFIDEIDALGTRTTGFGGSSEDNRTIDELLTQMDGFNKQGNITVIAATDQIELVDQALRRPGRFDEIIEIPLPDYATRLEILQHYLYAPQFKRATEQPIVLESIVKETIGWSGSELEGLIKKAAAIAARSGSATITQQALDNAFAYMKKMHNQR